MIGQLTELAVFGIALAALANLIVLPVLIIWKLIRLERVVARMSGDLEGLVWEHESDDPPPGEDISRENVKQMLKVVGELHKDGHRMPSAA
jgi:predicted RND superfamily exporter protein